MAKRRANGDGSIYQRGSDGRWASALTLENGDRKHFIGRTYAAVKAQLDGAKRAQQNGLPVKVERWKFWPFAQSWLKIVQPSLKPRTWTRYEQLLRCHAQPALGKTDLQKITPQQIQGLYEAMLNGGLAPATVLQLHAVLHKALKQAVRWNYLARNVADAVTPPRPRRTERNTLSPEQSRLLLEAAQGHKLEALVVLGLTTGMRQGELLGLRWQDVEMEQGVIRIQHSLQRSKDGFVLTDPKTNRSRRSVMLTDIGKQALHRHRVLQEVERVLAGPLWDHQGFVFASLTGGALDGTHVLRQCFYPLLKKAGLPKIRFHDLRHTAATLLLSQSVNPKIVSEILGHSNIYITLDLYSHVTPTMQAQAAATMNALLN